MKSAREKRSGVVAAERCRAVLGRMAAGSLGCRKMSRGSYCFPGKLLGKAGAASRLAFTAAAGTGSAHHFCLFGSEREAAEGL